MSSRSDAMFRGRPTDFRGIQHYGSVSIAMHWLIALFIIGLIFLGFWMGDLPKGTPARGYYFNLHKSLGVIAGVLILLRAAWRAFKGAPPLPLNTPAWQERLAKLSHGLLYLFMIVQPVTGYLGSAFTKYGVKVFGVPLPRWAPDNPAVRGVLNEIHEFSAYVLTALVILHVLGALWHLIRRDGVFSRMTRPE